MKAAPPIENIEVLDNFEIIIKFEGLSPQIVDLKKFNLLGPKARRLGQDIKYLRSFELVAFDRWSLRFEQDHPVVLRPCELHIRRAHGRDQLPPHEGQEQCVFFGRACRLGPHHDGRPPPPR